MSSRTKQLLAPLRDRLETTETGFECAFCSQPFERDRLNCPACGCSEIREL